MKKLTLFFILLSFLQTFSQEDQKEVNIGFDSQYKYDFGVGYGLNYGGYIGAQMQYIPVKHIALFGSAGFYVVELGWQVGLSGYLIPKESSKPIRVYGTIMYGTNAAISRRVGSELNRTYLGITYGGGLEMRFGEIRKHGLNIDIFFPIRSDDFSTDLDKLKSSVGNQFEVQDPLPFTISIGYHFEMK